MTRLLKTWFRLGIALLAVGLTQLSPKVARGEEKDAAGPPEPKDVEILDEHGIKSDTNSRRVPAHILNQRLQIAGHITLGTGFGAALVGITLIEVDSFGSIGKTGFITAAAGTGVAIVGMFLLGFSHPVHTKKKRGHGLSRLSDDTSR